MTNEGLIQTGENRCACTLNNRQKSIYEITPDDRLCE